MLGHGFKCLALPALAAAVLLWAAGAGWAQHGGGHGGGGHGGGGGHAGGGHYGGGHYGGGHYGGGFYGGHYGGYGYGGYYHHHGFYGGGLYLGWYPGFYGYGGGYYPGAYQSFYYPYLDTYPDAPYLLGPSLAALGSPFAALGNAALPPLTSVVPAGPGTVVNFSVQVPPNAEIWIEGQKTNQTGAVRQFESPPLSPGVDYQYQIRARWTEGGTVIDQTRQMRVRAGDQFMVNFGKPAAAPLRPRSSLARP